MGDLLGKALSTTIFCEAVYYDNTASLLLKIERKKVPKMHIL